MNAKILIGLALAMFVLAAEVSGHCTKCGLDGGYDACGCTDRIFKTGHPKRPVPGKGRVVCKKYKDVEEFKPIGDACGCTNVEVVPAILPKPKCTYSKKESKEVMYDSDESYEGPKYIRAPKHMHDFEEEEEKYPKEEQYDVVVPVDVVSMNLVQQMNNKHKTKETEERMFFGFHSLPSERPTMKYAEEIPEEKMFTFEKQIVELKPAKQTIKCGEGSDAEVVVKHEHRPVNYLSYGDLGYRPEQVSKPNLVKKPCHYRSHSDESYGSHEYVRRYHKRRPSSSEEEEEEEVVDDSKEYVVKKFKKPVFMKKLVDCSCGN